MIADYAELIAEVSDRANDPDVALKAEMFVGLAENAIAKRLQVGEMESSASLATDADGVANIPIGFIRARSVMVGKYILPAKTLTEIKQGASGYAITSGVMQTSEVSATVDLVYYSRLPSLVENGTNWLFQSDPDIYLYAVLVQVFLANLDIEKAQAAETYLDQLIGLKDLDDRRRRLSPSRLHIAGVTP